MKDRGYVTSPKLVWLHQQPAINVQVALDPQITRRFDAGVEKTQHSASLIVGQSHLDPATKG